ncbi:MAG: peptidase M24, partial [Marinilabiliales bacterium]
TFGEHEHSVIPGIKVRNNGIGISTHKGALARAIFEGEVSQVMDIPGANKVVIVRHGNYLTVYQNLDEVFVMKGDKIKAKQNIGKIHTKATDHTTTIHLEIWKETNKMNPSSWLSHK